MNRDENAARVIAGLAGSEVVMRVVAPSCEETLNACGAGSTDWLNHRDSETTRAETRINLR